MRSKNKNIRRIIGMLMILSVMVCMLTATAVQTSAAAYDYASGALRNASLTAYIGDSTVTVLVFVILFLVMALVAVVVVILVVTNKKKDSQNPAPNSIPSPAPTNAQSFNHVQPQGQQAPMGQPPVMNQAPMGQQPPRGFNNQPAQGAFANNAPSVNTAVPADGAGDTTVLGVGSVGFILLRKNGNEKINISKPEFFIGKEKAKVDYCISNNNSISRRHAKIKVRAGKCYISDLGSTNCTYINGTKLSPNQEVALIPGDKIKFSNEEFEFIG